jgi:hypothetical protein
MSAQPTVVPKSAPATTPAPGHLFVSTALDRWFTQQPAAFARDVQIDDIAFRRLDPEYYAWLRSRMQMARCAAVAGRLPRESFDELRGRFNAVHEWAIEHFRESALTEAVRALNARDYQPPTAEQEPPIRAKDTTGVGRHGVSAESTALVDAISERAVALGWKPERLYGTGNGRMFSPDRGLVSFLKPGDRIGEVTLHSIEIIGPPPAAVRQRFYNPDVDQPWIRRVVPAAEDRRENILTGAFKK